jgi:hypothetical protein
MWEYMFYRMGGERGDNLSHSEALSRYGKAGWEGYAGWIDSEGVVTIALKRRLP